MVSGIYQWRNQADVKVSADPKAMADLARRKATPDTRDNTGRLLGDPEPGRSALDRKLEAERRRAQAIEALRQAAKQATNRGIA
jgi:hypothetical protein